MFLRRRPRTATLLVGVLGLWILARTALAGRWTLPSDPSSVTAPQQWLNDLRDTLEADRDSLGIGLLIEPFRQGIDQLVTALRSLLSQPALGLPIPVLGWLGVLALAVWSAWALGGVRVAGLTAAGLLFVGWQGLWTESMDTLAVTFAAVGVCLLVGVPLGIWAGTSERFARLVTPVLDLMQIMPAFVYLAPLTLLFLIGPASAVIVTMIYAMPPAIRITAHGLREVPKDMVEAAVSMGATRGQLLRTVLLPAARRTIVLGANQTIMAALSMVCVASLIDAPGLGKNVLKALESMDVGTACNAGLALVVLGVLLDRVTTAAAERERFGPGTPRRSRSVPGFRRWSFPGFPLPERLRTRHLSGRGVPLLCGAVVVAVCIQLSRTFVWAAQFPTRDPGEGAGRAISAAGDAATLWTQENLPGLTTDWQQFTTTWAIDPLQSLLSSGPWWVTMAALALLALVLAGPRTAGTVVGCLGCIVLTGLWQDSMVTLASTLVATAAVLFLGLVLGVWVGRSRRADRVVRPLLDAGQVMPPFVYLVPCVALFGAGRFTAIVAAVVFSAPVAIKIVADGIRGVPEEVVQAATAAGSTPWQLIRRVQLPMSARALLLACNQGLIYVLSMVVVGGLVGGGALGFDVVSGFSQGEYFGKGLLAGLDIVLLGIVLDRITHGAGNRWHSRIGPPAVQMPGERGETRIERLPAGADGSGEKTGANSREELASSSSDSGSAQRRGPAPERSVRTPMGTRNS
ncbi:MAG: glycine betaine/proline transport system permease protein [Actinomycetota bacterium]|nr:glycine betaine/proline transport system permease protein [Actinomycetota bacterium]